MAVYIINKLPDSILIFLFLKKLFQLSLKIIAFHYNVEILIDQLEKNIKL